jgi:hypothetical protein
VRDGRGIEMIVMVVRENYDVNRRQAVEVYGWRNPAPGPEELQRRSALAPDGVDENVEPRDLEQKARMSDPRDRELFRRSSWHYKVRSYSRESARVGIRTARISPPLDQRPLEKIHESVHLRGRPWIPESTVRPMM